MAVSNLNSQYHKLYLILKNDKQLNIQANITNLDRNDYKIEITFKSEQQETEEISNLTFYENENDFLTFSNIPSNINLNVFSSNNNQLKTQILPQSDREKLIICYNGFDCIEQNNFSVLSDENYFSSINDDNFEKIMKDIFSNTKLQSIRLYFSNDKSPEIDFSFIPFDLIQNVDIIGHSHDNPQKILLTNQDQIKKISDYNTQNVIFLMENDTSQKYYSQKSDNTLIKALSVSKKAIIPFSYDFTIIKQIKITIDRTKVTMESSTNEGPGEPYSFTYIEDIENIFNIKNSNDECGDVKITIVPTDALKKITASMISFRFEKCSPTFIEFSGWKDFMNLNIMFHFYSPKPNDFIIEPSQNKHIQYQHYSLDEKELFAEYPSIFVFYKVDGECKDYYKNLNPLYFTYDIEDKSILSLINETVDDSIMITLNNILLCLDYQSNDGEYNFNFLSSEKPLKITLYNYFSENISLKINDFPNAPKNELEIIKCNINVTFKGSIDELVSKNSYIFGNDLSILHGTFYQNVDLFHDDINFAISDSAYWFVENNYKYKETDDVILKIHTNSSSSHIAKFIPISKKPCGVNLKFEMVDSDRSDITIEFEKNWSNIDFNHNGNIQINVSLNEEIIINTIPKNINFNVFNIGLNKYIHQIPVLYKQSKIVVCYESFNCAFKNDFSIDNDTMFISTKNRENYNNLISSINKDKNYDYLKLVFLGNGKVNGLQINDIPSNCEQIQLYGYDNAQILLEKGSDTGRFKRWLINQVTFAKNAQIKYNFDELTIINTDNIFQDVLSYSSNIKINKAIFHCRKGYSTLGLNGVQNIEYSSYLLFPEYDLDSDSNNYKLSIMNYQFYGNSDITTGYGDPIIEPIKTDSKFIFHVPKPNFNFYIYRFKSNIDEVSIKFEDIPENFRVKYVCDDSDESKKYFIYNFEIDDSSMLQTDQGNCGNVSTIINNYPALPTQSPTQSNTPQFTKSSMFTKTSFMTESNEFSQSFLFSYSYLFTQSLHFSDSYSFTHSSLFSESVAFSKSSDFSISSPFSPSVLLTTIFSNSAVFSESSLFTPSFPFQDELPKLNHFVKRKYDCSYFHMKSNGFRDEDENDIDLGKEQSQFIDIGFTSKEIFIEESNKYSLSKILYFVAENSDSTININENLKNSVIGIKTDNSPKIILNDFDSSINLMNYEHGYTIIDIECHKEHDKDINLQMRDVNNSNGYLILSVAQKVQSISFTSLFMARISSFEIRQNTLRRRMNGILLNEEDEEKEDKARIIVKDNINISSESNVILTNVQLKGKLNIYDDSILTFKKETIFDPKSMINISIKNPKDSHQQPIIRFDDLLNTTPDKFTITFDKKVKSSDLKNYVVLEGTNFKTCLTWIDKLEFINKGKTEIESKCEYSEGGITRFIISVKKKKLSLGAIIGIVLGCIAFVSIIILIILLIKRQRKNSEVEYTGYDMKYEDS